MTKHTSFDQKLRTRSRVATGDGARPNKAKLRGSKENGDIFSAKLRKPPTTSRGLLT
jgi:hypothetical protein